MKGSVDVGERIFQNERHTVVNEMPRAARSAVDGDSLQEAACQSALVNN